MDDSRFDAMTRLLAGQASRRLALGGLFGAAAAMLPGSKLFAAKPRRGRGSRGDDTAALPGSQVGGIWEASIEICHFDFDKGDYEVIMVSAPSLPTYLEQGHTLHIDCCVDSDCGKRLCLRATGCIEGACAYEASEGEQCLNAEGLFGVCDRRGHCEVTTAPTTTGEVTTVG